MRGRVRAVGAALSVLVLAACGGGAKNRVAPAPATTSTTAVRCATSATTDAPESARSASTTSTGDFDGDGRPDRLVTFRVGSGPWRVRVEFSAGGGDELTLPAGAEGVRALGGARLDVGPGEAALAVVGTSAAGASIGLFVVRACRLVRVTLSGAPAEFAVRSSAAARDGLTCQPPGLVAYSATSADGQTFRGTTVGYLLVGAGLDETHRATQNLGPGDPELPRFSAFSCGALKLG